MPMRLLLTQQRLKVNVGARVHNRSRAENPSTFESFTPQKPIALSENSSANLVLDEVSNATSAPFVLMPPSYCVSG